MSESDLVIPSSEARDMGDLVRFHERSLEVNPDITLSEVGRVHEHLALMHEATSFWLGDFLIQVEDIHGENLWQVINKRTGMNHMTVSRSIPPSERFKELSWSHHRAVSSLEPHERREILEEATQKGWTSRKVEEVARELKPLPAKPVEPENVPSEEEVVIGEVVEDFDEEQEVVEIITHVCPTCEGRGVVEKRS